MFTSALSVAITMILLIAFTCSAKNLKWMSSTYSSFECGYTSYFCSRFSYSAQFFVISMIFLILDLEICMVIPFFLQDTPDLYSFVGPSLFILMLTLGLLGEWGAGALRWKA